MDVGHNVKTEAFAQVPQIAEPRAPEPHDPAVERMRIEIIVVGEVPDLPRLSVLEVAKQEGSALSLAMPAPA